MDADAFDEFYTGSFARVVGQVYAMCGNFAEAQDCTQEAFVRAWERRRKLEQAQSPEAWVRTVAWRLTVSRWRHARLSLRPPDRSRSQTSAAPGPGIAHTALITALRQISPEQRRAIVLHHLCDRSVAEIAAETGSNLGRSRHACRAAGPHSSPCSATQARRRTVMSEAMDSIERRLRSLSADASRAAHGLPAGGVRARGHRHRRRVAVASALAALTVIGTGAIAFGAAQSIIGGGGVPPASEPAPPGGWVQEIPAEFVIDADPPPDDAAELTQGPDESLGIVDAPICGTQGIDGSPEPIDQLGFRTALQWRGLTLFASDVDARKAFYEFISRANACPTDSGTDPTSEWLSAWATPMYAESGYVVVTETLPSHVGVPSDVGVFYHLALQGNSVAVVRTNTLLSPEANVATAVQTASEQGARAAAGIAKQLCVFSSKGCGVDVELPPWLLDPGSSPAELADKRLEELRRLVDRWPAGR